MKLPTPQPLIISTGLQPGVGRESGRSRFNGLAYARNVIEIRKRLKPFRFIRRCTTRLKPGANERRSYFCIHP